ncbi:hypothetical protein Tco_1533502 [Tanacetum coccineum]
MGSMCFHLVLLHEIACERGDLDLCVCHAALVVLHVSLRCLFCYLILLVLICRSYLLSVSIMQVYLATITDSESEPFEDFRETEIPQPLPIAPSPVPPLDDSCLIVRQAHTPVTIDTESELEEAPSDTKEFQPLAARTAPPSSDHTPISSDSTPVSPLIDEEFDAFEPSGTRITSPHSITPSDSTTPLSPGHPLTQAVPALTLSQPLYYRKTARIAMQLIEDLKDESSNSDIEGEVSEDEGPGLEDEGPGLGDEGPGSEEEEEEASPEGEGSMPSTFKIRQSFRSVSEQQRVEETPAPRPPVRASWVNPIDGTVYIEIPIYVPPVHVPVQTPPSPEWSSGAQLELHKSILLDYIQRLDILPPVLFEGYNKDLRELYTGSREVSNEISSQRYRLRSLKQEHKRVTVTFGA